MRFRPVTLPAGRELNGRASQTLLRHYSRCPRAGYLARAYESASTAEMERGKAVHLIHERMVRLMLAEGERTIPAEIAKALADEVLAEVPAPFSEHDSIREMTYRLATEVAVDPEAVVAVETLFVVDVTVPCPLGCSLRPDMVGVGMICEACGGARAITFEVRCRIDFAEVIEGGAVVHVEDVKTAKAAVPYDEISRKRPDGSLSAKSFQLVLYAIALAYGVPVREEECGYCHGSGWQMDLVRMLDDPEADGRRECPECTRGRIEVREPFPVASRAQRFDLEFVYPAIENAEGAMLRRRVSLTRLEVEAYRASLEGLVARLAESERTGDWPAVVSDEACSECPASILCPIPKELKDHRGTVNTLADAAEAFEVREREKKVQAAKSKELRLFVQQNGPVVFGGGMVAELGHQESTRIVDKEALFDAVDRAVRFGEPYERHRYVKTVESFPLVVRALSADELVAIQSEGSNGEGSEGRDGGDGADPERGRDERWGESLPE